MRLGYLTSIFIIPLMVFTANFDQGNSQKNKEHKAQKGQNEKSARAPKGNEQRGRDKQQHKEQKDNLGSGQKNDKITKVISKTKKNGRVKRVRNLKVITERNGSCLTVGRTVNGIMSVLK